MGEHSERRYYKMDSKPLGICLIINNFEFAVKAKNFATGPADKENLTRAFRKLGFEIWYRENLTCEQMKAEMKTVQSHDHSAFDCFVCCISSHGNKHGVSGTDHNVVSVEEELMEYLYAGNCKTLRGKPKMFFVDACRTDPQRNENSEGKSATLHRGTTPEVVADTDDFVLSYATTPRYSAYGHSDPEKGARYFYHLTRTLEQHAMGNTLAQIMEKVHRAMKADPSEMLQTPQYSASISKELYFSTQMAVYIKPARKGSKPFTLRVHFSEKVSRVKAKIRDEQNIPRDLQRLEYHDKELEDDRPLSDYNIRDNTTIDLIERPATIFVKSLTGKTFTFEMWMNDTVEALMDKIFDRISIPPEEQSLVFEGVQLEEGNTLAHYELGNMKTVHLVQRLPGGGLPQ